MHKFVKLGVTAPRTENCADRMGRRDSEYYDRAYREAEALIGQLRRLFGQEPDGAELSSNRGAEFFYAPASVICYYDNGKAASIAYAQTCNDRCPQEWDDQARQELSLGPAEQS